MYLDKRRVIRNPDVLLREDLPDAAMLFDPASDLAVSLNPTAVCVWKHLDECEDLAAIRARIEAEHDGVPDSVDHEVQEFVTHLLEHGLAAEADGAP